MFNVIIPARFSASRLPGKPLLDIAGKPMIQHVYERATESLASNIIIATDDRRIQKAAKQFGADVCMTKASHLSGTDRLAEVAAIRNFTDNDIVVNVQGDEPSLPASLINQVATDLNQQQNADITSLYTPINHQQQVLDRNVVKVVMDSRGYALYFSRAPIPYLRDHGNKAISLAADLPYYQHIGVYGYRAGFLKKFGQSSPCMLEQQESLEQLRAIYYGSKIHLTMAKEPSGQSVDSDQDLRAVRRLFAKR